MRSTPRPSSKVKERVFALFAQLAHAGIHIDDVQLSDVEPLFASMNRPCTPNTLYIYRFMFKNPGKFEKMRARAEQARRRLGGK